MSALLKRVVREGLPQSTFKQRPQVMTEPNGLIGEREFQTAEAAGLTAPRWECSWNDRGIARRPV